MCAKIFNVRNYDETIEFSTILELYNKLSKHLNPAAVEITEEYASALLSSNPNLQQNSLIFGKDQDDILGFASIIQLPFYKNEWFALYGMELEYLNSELPGELIKEILNLGKKNNIPELYIQTTGELSASFDDTLEKLGFKPIHYYFSLILDDFDLFNPPEIPKGIVIHITEEFDDFNSIVSVVNEAFKDSFLWAEIRPRKWKKQHEALKKNHIMEYAVAYDGNKVVGFCNSYFNPNQELIGTINPLGVLPSYHHRGIGSALFASRVEFLRDKGCQKVNLPVDAKNERALKLYEKFGFYQQRNLTTKTYQLI
ncbi:MAG: GNAT family N-acetyltransferase [Promethearchaeota archaeon]|nr:MAG: GNAT family N-acetyltransferase [Candidatus Lokiarchaeota archaeon]